ncbi:MAG: class I SAM-dependent methyltransferase [Planctomycetes bacterium]|nr:class I SAM-dependent methyltransferase [Planctomycetota bacterium]
MDRRQEVEQHYAELLAPVYVWMLGGPEAAAARAKAWVEQRGLAKLAPGIAVDLGCGPGFHARALADAGFETLGVDSSPELLAEIGDPRVRTFAGDLVAFEERLGGARAKLVLCLGDTLTHLASERELDLLFDACARALAPGGVLALTFRDYSLERRPSECLIRVREEPGCMLSCALDFEPARVRVTDILHEWRDGRWIERRSAYSKLRLAPARVREKLLARGFTLETDEFAAGLVTLVALRT